MRSVKTLSKMKDKVKEQLPDWFEGEVYEIGDEVRNPFSGETIMLDAAELSMYELVKGAEIAMQTGFFNIDCCIDIMNQGRDWMLAKNPKAYMTLLD